MFRSIIFLFLFQSKEKKVAIQDAWDSALEIANVVYYNAPKYKEATEVDFLGSYDLNADSQDDMTKVLQNAATFTKPYFWNPFGWFIDIHCDDVLFDSIQGKGGCSTKRFPKKTAAYTMQADNALSKSPIITFCPLFFSSLKTCGSRIEMFGKSPMLDRKLDMNNYQCRGYATLHEIFHLDWESKVGNQGHIVDKVMPIKREFNGKIVNTMAYGPEFTKVLAQYDSADLGKFVSTNADNLAQYSLARWVTKKIGAYPHDPRSGLQPVGDPWNGTLKYVIQDRQLTLLKNASFNSFDASDFLYTADGPDVLCSDENDSNTGCDNPENIITITRVMMSYVAEEPTIPSDPPTSTIPESSTTSTVVTEPQATEEPPTNVDDATSTVVTEPQATEEPPTNAEPQATEEPAADDDDDDVVPDISFGGGGSIEKR